MAHISDISWIGIFDAFGVLSLVTAALCWLALAAFWTWTRRTRTQRRYALMLGWLAHVALFWLVSVVRRLWFGYSNPSTLMSIWASGIQIQAFVGLLAYVGINWLEQRRHGRA